MPQACRPGPAPPPGPLPPAPPNAPPYGGRCAVTASRKNCTCGGVHPPFGAPANPVQRQEDYHFPASEPAERAGLVRPVLVSVDPAGHRAVLRHPGTAAEATVSIGQAAWGWVLRHVGDLPRGRGSAATGGPAAPAVVVEHVFAEWGQLAFLVPGDAAPAVLVRKPVGRLDGIAQPVYNFSAADPGYGCKQDVDPTDWLGKLAANMSGGEEATPAAAASVMAPNTDNGLFGNPEEYNKFTLSLEGVLYSMPWGGPGPQGSGGNGYLQLWDLAGYSQCAPVELFPQRKLGMAGRYLRAVNQGVWGTSPNGTACGSEVLAVSPPVDPDQSAPAATSVALLRVVTAFAPGATGAAGAGDNATYIRAVTDVNGTKLLHLDVLGESGGDEFYAALLAQTERWDPFVARGAVPALPASDQRYADTAASLLTMYMNTDQGLVPEYGAGQFWNTYNINLPLDTLALAGALLEWGHWPEALQYLSWFFANNVRSAGTIDYKNFGCDSDADYGRIIDTFATAARYSGNVSWARALLPSVHTMAQNVLLQWRSDAVAAFPQGNPLHGIVPGSPEHDICHAPGYFFSVNVWGIRGLEALARLHGDFPALSLNASWEQQLAPTASAWRDDVRFAANFTAVRKSDGSGELFFLSPVVGSVYGLRTAASPPLLPGGTDADCVNRTTCFASMSAGLPGGGSNQHTNYANFRIFSETLLAGVLDPEYELAIISFREAHRGTLLGMTRFRDVLDDMPILGYGEASLRYDRLYSFHNTLAGHSLNYLSRGTYWGTEQRAQIDYSNDPSKTRYRNHECGIGGEDCSLCMVSAVASSYWVRWMLVTASEPQPGSAAEQPVVHIARGAPRRWYAADVEPWGIERAPTALGHVSFTMQPQAATAASPAAAAALRQGLLMRGSVLLEPLVGAAPRPAPRVAIHLRAPKPAGGPAPAPVVNSTPGATLVAWHPRNETAVFSLAAVGTDGRLEFNFTARFA